MTVGGLTMTQQAQNTPGNCMLGMPDGVRCTPQALCSMLEMLNGICCTPWALYSMVTGV